MDFDQPPVVRVYADPDRVPPRGTWPRTVPAVEQLLTEGLDLPPGVTFLVGENGSGKSTLVEGVAVAYGLSPEGGSWQGQLELVQHWRRYLDDPHRYLRHVVD